MIGFKLFFWQNCISPHQLPYIKELIVDNRIIKVYLIAPLFTSLEREKMGWNSNITSPDIDIIIMPDSKQVEKLFHGNQENSIHFFSGIRADLKVYEWFKVSLNYKIKRGLITEPPFTYNKPLFFHKIRFLLFDYVYISKINYVFGMGQSAVNYYKFWSNRWEVFLFGYCVQNQIIERKNQVDNNLKLVYVGSLIKRKNVLLLLKAFNTISKNINISLDIIGEGPEFEKLNDYVIKQKLATKIFFKGNLSMSEIHSRLSNYNVLILPSVHDGWGAVVNEGLQSGLFIIVSDACGAKTLIEDSDRGFVFKNNDLESLSKSLDYCIQNREFVRSSNTERINWSEKISGRSMSKYMIDCLFKDNVIPPWKN